MQICFLIRSTDPLTVSGRFKSNFNKIQTPHPCFMRQWHKHQSCGVWGDCWHVNCTLSVFPYWLKHEAANHPALPHTHSPQPHTHTPTHIHTHSHIYSLLKMPISAEQWRASVGAANASRRPFQIKRRWPCWEVFLCLLAALLMSTLLPGGGWRGTGSGSEYRNMWCVCRICHVYTVTGVKMSGRYKVAFNACMCRLLHHKKDSLYAT